MKKILFVTNHLQFGDGVANALVGFANALDENKFDITIIPIFRYDKKYAQKFNNNIKIKPIFKTYFRGFSKIINLVPYSYWYNKWIKDNYDIEVAFQYGVPTKLIAASLNRQAKHVVWVHTYDDSYVDYENNYDKFVCCSKSGEKLGREAFNNPDKWTHIYNLIEDNNIIAQSNNILNVSKNYKFTFCSVGRLSYEKGYDRLLECHKKLIEEGMYHNLWIIGCGPEGKKLQTYIKENNLEKSVKLFGHQNNPYPYIKQCDMFVSSSRREGFATVIVEAALLGKSILTTNVSGAEEFVAKNEIGIMVNNDTNSIYNGMKTILLDTNMVKFFENNISKIKDLHYRDRLVAVEKFFNEL